MSRIHAACGAAGMLLLAVHSGDLHAQSPAKPVVVSISIKPGDSPVTLEPKRGGMVPIAILSTRDFDAARVDPLTVKAGATGSAATIFRSAKEDVNKDGRVDLLLLFRLPDMKLTCSDTQVRLTGKTETGADIEGRQAVTMEGC